MNSSYGQAAYVAPNYQPPVTDHIYDTPASFANLRNQNDPSSFSPTASIMPRLGTLKRARNNYVDLEVAERLKLVPVSAPKPHKNEEIYDVYNYGDSSLNVEEVYDHTPNETTNQGPGNSKGNEYSVVSIESDSTGTSDVQLDEDNHRNSSVETAENPLYDTLKHNKLL